VAERVARDDRVEKGVDAFAQVQVGRGDVALTPERQTAPARC